MSGILLHLITAALYAGLALWLWRCRWQGAALARPIPVIHPMERLGLLTALLFHAVTLREGIFPNGVMHFGFATALSAMLWLAIALYWVESFYLRIDGLPLLGLPAAAACALLPALVPEEHVIANAANPAFRLHFLMAMLAYSLFTIAALHALLMMALEKHLHRGKLSPFLASLPPLMTMERLLFRLIHVAFVLLTFTLLSGAFFSEEMFGKPLTMSHKTVFALVSWITFAALLVGRHLRGWRGKLALRWTLTGFGFLLLAYVGSYFVLDVLLHRSA
ncbi:MAG: cytochrome C biogenesis protein [Rhodocyclaceae bacterium]|nr:MAG: cytochrome C biogenesis protein [Rhodocyclaceae bacterium]